MKDSTATRLAASCAAVASLAMFGLSGTAMAVPDRPNMANDATAAQDAASLVAVESFIGVSFLGWGRNRPCPC